MSSEEFDCDYTDEIVCPYCGYEYEDSWECVPDNYKSINLRCCECNKRFELSFEVEISYTSSKLKQEN